MRRIKFTKEGLAKLKTEYEKLKTDRPSAVKELSRARELGDLSENGLYHAAKANLSSIDSRLRRLSTMIKLAYIGEPPTDRVGIGSKVIVEQNGKKIEYQIVGDYEADPLNKKISSNSPIGRAIFGKKANEKTQVETPNGTLLLKIAQVL